MAKAVRGRHFERKIGLRVVVDQYGILRCMQRRTCAPQRPRDRLSSLVTRFNMSRGLSVSQLQDLTTHG